MGFFDLNIPYPEPSPAANKSSIEANRTKLAVKAMELGFTGIAYNRTIKGVMSDHHRCSISPLSLSSLLKVLPSLSLSAKLHRDLLGIPLSTPFRQYTRLTVCVDSTSHAQALNSGNPVLKTYDLVAVKPSNQLVFDLACERMEVDIILIDFSTKLPFRLKQPLVKAAVQRGVCFELTYSGLISDVAVRKRLISGGKVLMDWTRGRNIIFSSGAPSVNELRGPCDVANLLSLLGLSKERAKDAISKNCRNLLANSLRKKRFYKEAIRVELLSSDAASHSKEGQNQELLKWDPISSEGDILLDDLAKSFSASCKAPKTAKAIDFASVVDSIPSHGFQVKDFLPASNAFPAFPDNKVSFLPVAEKVSPSTPVLNNSIEQPNRHDVCPERDKNLVSDAITTQQVVTTTMTTTTAAAATTSFPTRCSQLHESSDAFVSHDKFCEENRQSVTTENFNSNEDLDTPMNDRELESEKSIDSTVDCTLFEAKAHDSQSNLCIFSNASDTVIPYKNETLHKSSEDIKLDDAHNIDDKVEFLIPSMDTIFPVPERDDHNNSEKNSDVNLNAKITRVLEDPPTEDFKIVEHPVSEINTATSENLTEDEQSNKPETEAAENDEMPQQTPCDEAKTEDDSAVATHTLPDVLRDDQGLGEVSTESDQVASVQSVSGQSRVKRRTFRGPFLFPLKRMMNPMHFKKKGKKIKSRTKLK